MIRRWFRRRPDFAAELHAHLGLEADRLIADGSTPGEARAAARRAFGNVLATEERYHESTPWTWLEQLMHDLRYAVRGLAHSRAFTATAILTLAIGLGSVTVAFTIFNAYVLRPFAVRDPGGLYQLYWRAQDDGGRSFRWNDYGELAQRHDLFEAVVAEHTRFISSDGAPLAAFLVSDNYFDALGVRFAIGAPPRADGGRWVVLSDQAWSRLFARDPGVVGRDLDLNGRAFTIAGVLAREFAGLDEFPRDVWVPLTTYAALDVPDLIGPAEARQIDITVRLQRGVSEARAETALAPLMARMAGPPASGAASTRTIRADVERHATPNPMSLQLLAVVSPIFVAFGLVLATACANVSNVMLARAIARHREIAVRLSLGASRGRVVRQLLTEGLVIALVSGLAGLAVASWALRGALAAFFNTLPASVAPLLRVARIAFDGRVFLFALVVSAAVTLLFALLPAVHASRLSLTDALRGHATSGRRGSRLRNALVTAQIAVSIVLVIVALTLAHNGTRMARTDLGYDTRGVISVNVRGEDSALIRRLATVLALEPRVAEASATGGNPLFVRSRSIAASPDSRRAAAGTRYTFVSPEYFSLLRIPVVRGRRFRPDEAATSARVAIVSATTAAAFWPGEDAVGKIIRVEPAAGRPVDDLPGYGEVTVVGVAKDVVSGFLIDGVDGGHIYMPVAAAGDRATALLLRGRTDRDLSPAALDAIFRRVNADPQVFEALPLQEMMDVQTYPLRAASWVGSFLGLLALILSVSGLYGVLTYAVSQRTREIGIRMALGATAGAVVGLVMRQSARMAGLGALAGAGVTFGAMKMLTAVIRLRTIALVDAGAFAVGLALVAAATALAAYHPARRATRIDPAETLRADA